jgi:hypothetical protein
MPHPGVHKILVSPDGRLRAIFQVVERMSGAWSHSPRIIDQTDGVILIDLWNSEWDAALNWQDDGKVRLDLSRHGRAEWCALVLDPETRTFELFDREGPWGERETDAAPPRSNRC